MKIVYLTWLLLWVWPQACAQGVAAPSQDERTRIEAQRQRELTRHAQEEQACAGKFLVNDCLAAIRKRHRETLAELQRQEVLLNDAERARKATQQREITRGKQTGPAASSPVSAASKDPAVEDRRRKAMDKSAAQEQRAAATQARALAQAKKLQEHAEKDAAATTSKAALAEKRQRLYQIKQDEAAQHKADLQKRQREKTRPQAAPLPDPP